MSMLLPPFELHQPTTIDEAVALRAEHPDSDWIAGGTDLLPNYKWGLNARSHVISLAGVEEMTTMNPMRIGASVRLSTLERDEPLRSKLPVLPTTAAIIASPLLRAGATVGGNLLLDTRCFFFNQNFFWRKSIDFCLKAEGTSCHVVPQQKVCYATFSADLPAPLIALGAEFELVSASGRRRVAARDFYGGDGIERNVLRPDELLVAVHIPQEAQGLVAAYDKLRTRDSWDFPELGVAAAVRFNGDIVSEFHLVANALEMAPRVLDDLGTSVLGSKLTDQAIRDVATQVEASVRPVRNTSLLPRYRKKMSRVWTERVLTRVRNAAGP